MAYLEPETITLNGSGALTATSLSGSFTGLIDTITVNKNGQSNNPVITITELGGASKTLLTVTQTATGNASYPVFEEIVDNTGTASGQYKNYFVETDLQIAVTGGDNAGTITVIVQYIPVQG